MRSLRSYLETLRAVIAERDADRERFDLAQEVGGIGAWEWDITRDEGRVSDTYKTMHGLSAIEGPLRIGQVLAAIHPDDLPGYQSRLAAAKTVRHASTNEYRVVHPDGSIRWIAAKGRPLFASGGALVGAVGIVRDVTSEKETQSALDESRTRLELATEAAELGILDWEFATGEVVLSERSRRIYGVDVDGARPFVHIDELRAVLHPDDLAGAAAHTDALCDPDGPSPDPYHYRVLRPDGAVRWVRVDGRVVFDDAGAGRRPLRYIGAVIDVTDRRRAEEALQRQALSLEQRVEERTAERDRLWALSRDAFVVVADGGVILAASPALTSILGWTEDELVGRSAEWLLHPEDLARTRDARQRALAGEVVRRFENRSRTKDGGWRWLSWTATPGEGRIYSVARDVTDEHEQAEQLHIAEEALRQSQKMEAIGQITGGVAHDFNNLLTPILGALDLLQRRGLPDARSERLVTAALESTERARVLVQRLLAFARRQPLKPSPVQVAHLVGSVTELLSSTLGPRIAVHVDVEPDLPPALADANQLELALLNLAVNARDAMGDEGRFKVVVRPELAEEAHPAALAPGRYLSIAVSDTGAGMSREVLARAVEPFFSTKATGRGTGLGLSMVHGLTAQLGGGMTIDSREGAGTTVTLWLPVADLPAGPAAEPETAGQDLPHAGGRVLLVDDEAAVRASTAQTLADLGYSVVEAQSADEALARLQDGAAGKPVDILVTDHLMPGMTGADLARQVRETWPQVVLLIISGFTELAEIAPDLPRLNKPFRRDELAEALALARGG